jgi:hypothetical protein
VTWIAELPVTWVMPGGKRIQGSIAIGMPELVPDRDDDEAICPVTLGGLDGIERITRCHGVGTFQALLNALGFAARRIRDSVADGVRVEEKGGGDATKHLIWLFEMIRTPDPAPASDPDPEPEPG